MAEIVAKRNRYMKVFDDAPGNAERAVIHAGEIHYEAVDDTWQDVADLTDQATMKTKGKNVQFGITNGYMGTWVPGHHLGFRPWKIAFLDTSSGQTEVLADADYSNASIDGNEGTIHNVYPGSIDLQVQFAPRRMRKRYRLPSRPNLPDPSTLGMDPATTYLVFGYDVDNASNLKFYQGDTQAKFGNGDFIHDDIRMETAQGTEVLRLMAGEAVSATNFVRNVYYTRTALIPFGEAIAYSDIQAATYPLIVDPSSTVYAGTEDGEIADGTVNTTSTDVNLGTISAGKGAGDFVRYYCRFDLSGIDSGATCDTATLDLYHTSKLGSPTGNITPKLYTTDWGPTLAAGDHGQAGSDQGTIAYSSLSTSSYNSFDLTEADVEDWFGAGTYCSFEVRGYESGTANAYAVFSTANQAGTLTDPKLEITYTAGGPSRRRIGAIT
jgi:hypothetical protein